MDKKEWSVTIHGDKYNSDGSPDFGEVSDGYHTFNQLYDHRSVLFIMLLNQFAREQYITPAPLLAWWSEKHNDGTMYDNMFIAGVSDMSGNYIMSYHFEDKYKELFEKSYITKIKRAPIYPGTSPDEELENLKEFLITNTSRRYS